MSARPASSPSATSSTALHLLLPGLLWPAPAMRDMVFDLPLPALSWLLGKGRRTCAAVSGQRQWLSDVTGLANFPYAALRANPGATDVERWLCLDPIRLRVERTQFIVEDSASLQLSDIEAEVLVRDLKPLFAELGELHVAGPHEWHLRLAATAEIRTTPLPDAIGFNGDNLMPQADNVKTWRRLLNEAQMLLHAHPINLARQQRGLPAVNSLWPWGEGELHAGDVPHWDTLQADGALWRGFAQCSGATWTPLPPRFDGVAGKTLVVNDALAASTAQGDAMSWREIMKQLEADWFVPAVVALRAGMLNEIVLHGMGANHALSARVTKTACYAFWRSPASLEVLGIAA